MPAGLGQLLRAEMDFASGPDLHCRPPGTAEGLNNLLVCLTVNTGPGLGPCAAGQCLNAVHSEDPKALARPLGLGRLVKEVVNLLVGSAGRDRYCAANAIAGYSFVAGRGSAAVIVGVFHWSWVGLTPLP